ncbi:MAG: replicative DNA helicase [Planctomycetes bacterium]|nr:replicative DNA helicase [Planctomycetota bacterium]MCB9910876.1 replicative DNA helicase [Planctomycetota bacterium]MCB9912087.1 replicative DNA helicase [Planctomycetota bacterium]HPF14475.1 replicative DNA helicase [Planctomycetota bacterium]HRV80540.1 replicative DNA helicase [Planctomycetota bacterium]
MDEIIPPGRIAPHNEEAERSVLGSLLIAPDRAPEVAEFLDADDFFVGRHGMVYKAIIEMSSRNLGIDSMTLAEYLKANGKLQAIGGASYLAQLSASVSSAAHLMHHANLVNQTSMLRRLIRAAGEVIENAYRTPPLQEDVQGLLDSSEHSIFRINGDKDSSGAREVKDILNDVFKQIEASSERGELTGLPSGFYQLDEMLGGFNPGEMTIIAARPSMGKTAFVLNLMERAALDRPAHYSHNPVVLFFSLEMGAVSIGQRMLCSRARVDSSRLRKGKIDPSSFADLSQAAGELAAASLIIDDTPGLSIMALRSRARRVKHKYGLDMIVIDYLQLMAAKAESRQQEISLISRSLKELARELEVPLIALSQLSRQVESRENKRPQLSDLRESGSIEQDADVVLMLYRPEYYNPTEENRGKAEVICAKQRNGPTGAVTLHFQSEILRFENPAPSIAEPIQF